MRNYPCLYTVTDKMAHCNGYAICKPDENWQKLQTDEEFQMDRLEQMAARLIELGDDAVSMFVDGEYEEMKQMCETHHLMYLHTWLNKVFDNEIPAVKTLG